MKIPWHKKAADFLEGLIEHFKGLVLAVIAVVAILGAITGYRYYRYTEDEPHYCASCHLMQEAFSEWEKGKHSNVVCQKCHHLTVLEQNKLLLAYVARGSKPLSQTHGREKPWAACRGCHAGEISQGSVTIRKSYGHTLHAVLKKIDCKACHESTLHNFRPNEKACLKCHQDKGVHGVGMEAFSCLKCHSFSEKTPSMVPKDRCVKCHTGIAAKGPMSGLLCHECHKPHKKIIPTSELCAGACHRSETLSGQHVSHMKRGADCLSCHQPHSWRVGSERAIKTCGRCHPFKSPKTFVY